MSDTRTTEELLEELADDRATFENSLMLCGGSFSRLFQDAQLKENACIACGMPKAPFGRSTGGTGAWCAYECEGNAQPPHPGNLFYGEKVAVQRYLEALQAALDTLTSLLSTYESLGTPEEFEALKAVAEKARMCCIAMSDEGEPIDLCIQVGENADGPLYAIVDEVDTWTRAQNLLIALGDLDAHDHAERMMGR